MVKEREKMRCTLVLSPPAGMSITHPADMVAAVLTAISFSTTGTAFTKATRAVLARRRIVEHFMFAYVLI
jgi:hypothetical protein